MSSRAGLSSPLKQEAVYNPDSLSSKKISSCEWICPQSCRLSGPFFRDIHHGQIQHFQQAVVGGEHGFGFCHLAQLAVEALDGIGGVNQPPHLLRVLEIGAQVCPVVPPGWEIFGYFRSQCSPKVSKASSAACSSTAA